MFYSTSDFEFDREGLVVDLNHLQIQNLSDSEYMHIELVMIDLDLNYGTFYIKNSVFKIIFRKVQVLTYCPKSNPIPGTKNKGK